MKKTWLLIAWGLAVLLSGCEQAVAPLPATVPPGPAIEMDAEQAFTQFEEQLEDLRQALKIPGMSAAIVKDQELVWAKGFGYADLENQVEATPDTPYRLASVTKPIAATLIMQLVEEGLPDLDDPVEKYGVHLESEGVVRVWHLLTHTSEGIPGTRHNYSGDRYGLLGEVIKGASGQSFGELLDERILEPLDMTNTAPNYPECALEDLIASPEINERERNVVRVNRGLAKPYQLDPSYNVVEGIYPSGFNPAAGLISTVVDLAKFDMALDRNLLLGEGTKGQMFEPTFSTYEDRSDLMYGLGWYTQRYKGTRLLWHSGRWPPSTSSLYLKVPDENMTFIILANTTYLNTPYPFGYGDVLYCTPALAFYEAFVFPRQHGKSVPEVDWGAGERDLVNQLKQVTDADMREILERELWSYRQMYASMGQTERVNRLQDVHRQAYAGSRVSSLDSYAFRGVEYYPIVREQVKLAEADLEQFTGAYTLSDSPEIDGAILPLELSIEVRQGKLFGVALEGCVTLVAITPTRFAIPENPELELAFHMDGDEVESLTLNAGGLAVVYKPTE
jgi:CubicO group peptidase (beta-lactamase class C family)